MKAAPAHVTRALLIVTAAVSAAATIGLLGPHAIPAGGFIPARMTGLNLPWAVPAWITPLTATLLHGGWIHLGFNMLMLAYTGRAVEPVLGGRQLLMLYLGSAYLAAAGQWIASPGSLAPMIGASGAVSGVLAAYVMLYGSTRVEHRDPRIGRLLGLLWVAAAWIGLQLLTGVAFSHGGMGVAIAAHIGGFAGGLLLTPLLLRLRFRRPRPA